MMKSAVADPKVHTINIHIPYKGKILHSVINHVLKKSSELDEGKYWVVLTHGAGGDLRTPQLSAIAVHLASKGFPILRFTCKGLNIKYRINAFCEVLNFLNKKYNPKGIFIGGRSMGARAAAMSDSDSNLRSNIDLYNKILGIICLSYPLHKLKNTTELRDEPLLKLQKPVFFLSGTNDEMCQKEVMENLLSKLKSYKIQWLEGYDHSAKSLENYEETKYLEAFIEVLDWLSGICS